MIKYKEYASFSLLPSHVHVNIHIGSHRNGEIFSQRLEFDIILHKSKVKLSIRRRKYAKENNINFARP